MHQRATVKWACNPQRVHLDVEKGLQETRKRNRARSQVEHVFIAFAGGNS
jgi:hypothetical protein